jgi:RNA polymerase sigma factor (sigma-70 family)
MESREFDYDALVRPLEPRMMRSIWRIVRERQAAEDALQDALTVVWRKRRTVARHPNPQALILRIAVSAAYDAVRKSRRRLGHEVPGPAGDRADGSAPPVTKELEDCGLRDAILGAIARLPRRQTTAVLLRIVEERPYEEIALAMGCSEPTARVHVMRGKTALAKMLARLGPGLAGGIAKSGKESVS